MTDPIIKFISYVCVQTAVYWGSPVPDGYGGYTYAKPIEIKCRWDDVSKEIMSDNGEQIVCRAQVLTPTDVKTGGYLYLGSLQNLTLDAADYVNPRTVNGAYMIQRVEKSPLFRATDKFVIVAYL